MDIVSDDRIQSTEQPATASPVVPGTMDPELPEGPEAKSGIDKRFAKLTYQARQAEREAAYWRGVAEGKGGGAKDAPPADEMPKEEDYDSYVDYQKALNKVEWRKAAQDIKHEMINILNQRDRLTSFQAQLQDIRTVHQDFDDVAGVEDLAISYHMGDTLQSMPDGARILYHLGKNKEEAARIARMSDEKQTFELYRISGRLSASPQTPQPHQSTAPTPITPLKGVSSTSQKDPAKMTDAEYEKYYLNQRRKKSAK